MERTHRSARRPSAARVGSRRGVTALGALAAGAAACGAGGDGAGAAPLGVRGLAVEPRAVACAVGERVRLAASGAGARSAEFVAADDRVRVDAAAAAGGAATVTCAAVGEGAVIVRAAGDSLAVPVRVARAPGAVLGLDVEPRALTLVTAESWRLAARVRTRDGGEVVSEAVRFASLTPEVVTVDAGGVVRAEGAGEGTVVARAAADPDVAVAVAVTVRRGSAAVQSIFVLPPTLTLVVGDTARLTGVVALTAAAPPGTSRAVVFTSPDSAAVSVRADGLVLARRPGVARVAAAAAAAPALRATATVTVREPRP